MQINNQTIPGNLKTHDKPLELKQGEVYRAIIRDRSSNNEATVQIRGREVNVMFEGKPPIQDRVTIQITGTQNQVAQVKTISETPRTVINNQQSETANLNQALRSLGVYSPSNELRLAAQIVLDKGVPLSQESVSHLRNFVEKEKGSIDQRLNTVQAVANKRLEITPNHLRSVHEALHGRPLNDVLTNIVKEIDPKFEFRREENRQVESLRSRNDNRSLNDVRVNSRSEVGSQIENQNRTSDQRGIENRPIQERQLSNQVREVREQVQREPNVQRSIQQVRNEVVNNPRIDREVSRQVERIVEEASRLQQNGRELASRERLVQALQTAEREIARTEVRKQAESRVESRPQLEARVESRPQTEPRVVESRPAQERPVSDQVREIRNEAQRDPNVQRSIEQIRNEVINNPRVDREVTRQIERSVEEASRLHQSGRELASRERLVQALQTAEREIARTEVRPQTESRVESRTQVEPRMVESRTVQERPVNDQIRELRGQVQREPNVQRSIEQVRNEVVNNPRVDREVARQVERNVEEASRLHQSGRELASRERLVQALQTAEREIARTERTPAEPRMVESRPVPERPVSDQIREIRNEVQREPNVQRSIDQVRNEVVNNPRVDREVARQVERSVEEASRLQQNGRELASRERLVQALQTAEREIARTEVRTQAESRVETRPQSDARVENRPQAEPRMVESRPSVDRRTVEARPAQERQLSDQVRQVREQVQREPNVQRSIEQVRNEVVNNTRVDREVARQVDRGVNESRVLQQSGHETPARDRLVQTLQLAKRELNNKTKNIETQQFRSTNQQNQTSAVRADDALTKMLQAVQKEGDFNKVTKQIRELSQTSSLDRPTQETIERTVQDAEQIKNQGKELAARENIFKSLNEISQQVKSEQQATIAENRQYEVNEMYQGQQLSSKDLIVQTVTEKLAKAQNEFKQLQREITRNLDNSQRLLDMFKNQAQKQVKPILESTIKKLDNAILKSELMLFTDMKTEKNLMKASSQLAEAKKLLNKGNYQEASRIVQEVKTMIEKLVFKPSETKVKHFITKEQQNQEQSSTPRQLLQQFDEMTRQSAMREGSARQAFEMIRGLGLNRDSELAQILAGSRSSSEQEANQNLKSVLMKLMQSEDENVSRQSRQALANITGQQLLSKSDSNNNLQSIFMNLPFLLQDKVENLQVFVNSRKEGQQIDWENCNLYFLIETRKLGDVGILVTSTDRNLSLTIKNDQPFFKERMEPLAELCKENLKEVGYNITSLNFTKMTSTNNQKKQTEQGQEEQQEKLMPIFTEKGYDFKI